MEANGRFGNEEPFADLTVRVPLRRQFEDTLLLRSCAKASLPVRDDVVKPLDNLRRLVWAAGLDVMRRSGFERFAQGRQPGRFRHEGDCSCSKCVSDDLLTEVGAQDHHPKCGRLLKETATELVAGHVRQPDIDHCDFDRMLARELQGSRSRANRADNCVAALRSERRNEPLTYDLVIIDDQQPHLIPRPTLWQKRELAHLYDALYRKCQSRMPLGLLE
jgi:hypothetical protein